jgi:hypothetical protein
MKTVQEEVELRSVFMQVLYYKTSVSRVRFPALPDFLSSGGSGTGSTQPREVN